MTLAKTRQLVIIGDSAFAEVAYEYFTHDSPYEVVAFSVESAYLKRDTLFGLPVVPFEELPSRFDPQTTDFYAAIVYSQLNRLRARMYQAAKAMGFAPASYVSSRAFVWPNVKLGEHCFVFEDNTVQPFVTLGDNVVLWSGNHVGHHSTIESNCFISSHVVISGFCRVGENSFLGVNASVANNVTVGRDNWVAPGLAIMKGTADGTLFKPPPTEESKISAPRFFKLRNAE
jgi:sugar O-acyltransferase (sialic acid O-acetyltransferase NeuD family)